MKKIGYLIFPLLLLIACSSNQATSPSSQHSQSPETVSLEKEYEQIVDQYEAAAKEKVLKVSDYPLVNPVSLQMAHTYTGDGDLDIESEKEDLNGDGQEELLIGTDTPFPIVANGSRVK